MADSSRIRVAMICGYRPTPAGGGTEKYVYELTRGLMKRGVEVEIVCEDRPFLPDADNPLAERIVGIDPQSLCASDPVELFREKSRRFAESIDAARYDIIHCHGQYGFHIALRLARLVVRPALVSSFHLTALGPNERYRALSLSRPDEAAVDEAVAFMEQTMGWLSDRCIAVSNGVAKEVIGLYGVPASRVEVISNWCDPNIFRASDRESARERLGLKPGGRYLLYVGHFNMSRGKIMADVLRLLPIDVTLLVAHHEPDRAITSEFKERVCFTGHLGSGTLALYYSAADLLCFPSLYGGFGLVIIEAMACGCPPVVYDLPAMNEIVTDDSGYLVGQPTARAYAATIERALSEGRMKAQAARRRALTFDMDVQIDAILSLYRKVVRTPLALAMSGS